MAVQMPSRLYRSRSQKMVAGVCGGLGEYFDVDPVLIRLLFVVTAFISGAGILAYIVLWIVVPLEGEEGSRMDAWRRDVGDLTGRARGDVSGRAAPAAPGTPAGASTTAQAAGSARRAADPADVASSGGDEPMTTASPTADPSAHDDPLRADDPAATPGVGPASFEGVGSEPYGPALAPPPVDRRRRRQHWAGAILVVLGLLILANNLNLLWWIDFEYLLPLILVGAGAWLLFGRGRRG